MAVSVLFVCLGNICRSPTAHGVFEQQVMAAGRTASITVDSAGTGSWHVGEPPDARASAVAMERGYDLSALRARQARSDDFEAFDYILAMDSDNLAGLQKLELSGFQGHLGLFLDFHPDSTLEEVPDPYYGGDEGFERVVDMIEIAGQGLLAHIVGKHHV
jgi:protein-tyrosine phosphatase